MGGGQILLGHEALPAGGLCYEKSEASQTKNGDGHLFKKPFCTARVVASESSGQILLRFAVSNGGLCYEKSEASQTKSLWTIITNWRLDP